MAEYQETPKGLLSYCVSQVTAERCMYRPWGGGESMCGVLNQAYVTGSQVHQRCCHIYSHMHFERNNVYRSRQEKPPWDPEREGQTLFESNAGIWQEVHRYVQEKLGCTSLGYYGHIDTGVVPEKQEKCIIVYPTVNRGHQKGPDSGPEKRSTGLTWAIFQFGPTSVWRPRHTYIHPNIWFQQILTPSLSNICILVTNNPHFLFAGRNQF